MNMLQHGEMIHQHYLDLYRFMEMGTSDIPWALPPIFLNNTQKLLAAAQPPQMLRNYQIYHDCGKHVCRVVDENGKQHFPEHAKHSAEQWLNCGGDAWTGDLIARDMDMHTLRGDELKIALQKPDSVSLLLTAWCEIHANCKMFGGTDSTSFKIKAKHLEKATKWWLELQLKLNNTLRLK